VSVFRQARWSPYVVGVLIGVLSWVTFATMDKALGTSTTMVRAVGAAERVVAPEHVAGNAYFTKYLGTEEKPKPWFEWQFALVIFLPLGAWLGAKLSKTSFKESVPPIWRARFGDGKGKRWAFAFLGGAIMLFGARMAGGCTSGHALSGGLQLAVGSWIFVVAMFATGVATAWAVYGRKGADRV
jgi:uncharacterized membrane protein YedE/YeeE